MANAFYAHLTACTSRGESLCNELILTVMSSALSPVRFITFSQRAYSSVFDQH